MKESLKMISNASPLIVFGKLNKLDLLISLFKNLEITESVYKETVENGIKLNKPEAFIIKKYIEKKIILIKKLNKESNKKSYFLRETYYDIDVGEADTIALALKSKEKELLIDEKLARKVAELHGFFPIGSLGIILLAYKKNILNENESKKIVNIIISGNFRVGAEVLNEFWILFNKLKKAKG